MQGAAYRWVHLLFPVQMWLSAQLWWPTTARLFPLTPVSDLLVGWPLLVSGILSSALAISCVVYALGFGRRAHPAVALGLTTALCALDLNRLQVWVWMWWCLWALEVARRTAPSREGAFQVWVLAAVYVWGGLNKLTPWFLVNYDWFCETFSLTAPLSGNAVAGYAMALTELLMGLLLLWPRTRRAGVWLAWGMHAYILLVLGPLGRNWNMVVWPWNITMMVLLGYFYYQNTKPASFSFSAVPLAVWVATWMLPAANIYGWWPESMSWKMYSNTHREATLIAPAGLPCPNLTPVWEKKAEYNRLLIDDWSYEELHVPAFNSMRNYEYAAQCLRACKGDSIELEILIVERWKRPQ